MKKMVISNNNGMLQIDPTVDGKMRKVVFEFFTFDSAKDGNRYYSSCGTYMLAWKDLAKIYQVLRGECEETEFCGVEMKHLMYPYGYQFSGFGEGDANAFVIDATDACALTLVVDRLIVELSIGSN